MKYNEDGSISIRQSWLSDFVMDPERARLAMLHPEMDEGDSDVAAVGTAAHLAIEEYLNGHIDMADMAAFARHVATETLAEGNIRWVDLNAERFIAHAGFLAHCWATDLSPFVPRGGICEHQFTVPMLRDGEPVTVNGRPLMFEGTMDYVTPDIGGFGLWDWKTSGRSYQQWEKQRWAIQPSVYAYAANVDPALADNGPSWPVDFNYGIMIRSEKSTDKTPYAAPSKGQRVNIRRFESHAAWIIEQAVTAATFVLSADINTPWPAIDSHALCSEKWCPWWSKCKGAYLTRDEHQWKSS